ncbi:MAG: hypothetical protein ACREXR_13400, partial [Gammaproteobacteria bacterium]
RSASSGLCCFKSSRSVFSIVIHPAAYTPDYASPIRRRQIGRHALDFFRDPEVALEEKSFTAGRADAGGNTFVA